MPYASNTSGTTLDGIRQACIDLVESSDNRPYARNTDGTTTIDGILDALTDLVAGEDNSPYVSNSQNVTLNGILAALTDLVKGTNNSSTYSDNTGTGLTDSMLNRLRDIVRGEDNSPYYEEHQDTTSFGILDALIDWQGPFSQINTAFIEFGAMTTVADATVLITGNVATTFGAMTTAATGYEPLPAPDWEFLVEDANPPSFRINETMTVGDVWTLERSSDSFVTYLSLDNEVDITEQGTTILEFPTGSLTGTVEFRIKYVHGGVESLYGVTLSHTYSSGTAGAISGLFFPPTYPSSSAESFAGYATGMFFPPTYAS